MFSALRHDTDLQDLSFMQPSSRAGPSPSVTVEPTNCMAVVEEAAGWSGGSQGKREGKEDVEGMFGSSVGAAMY
jgi:hypothetical protein